MKVLITGGSGFLGWNLCKSFRFQYETCAFYNKHNLYLDNCSFYKVDIRNEKEVIEKVKEISPDVIVHTAAIANAQLCEIDKENAYKVNVEGTRNIKNAAEAVGAKLIYISTDLVYSGDKDFFTELDPPAPKSYYAKTKLEAEGIVRDYENHIILRIALLYGWGNVFTNSFTDWLHTELRAKRHIKVFTDQFRTPIYVMDVADAIKELIQKDIKNELFNLGGPEKISRYEFAKRFVETFGYKEELLEPVKMEDVKSYVSGVKDCSLDSSKIQKILSFKIKNINEGLNLFKKS